ncbi:MAG: TrmB family transcriptional regulator [Candidatus Kariarchaeaceae archaeon]|jgi:sugar-specific transcriptional regulator TrmB
MQNKRKLAIDGLVQLGLPMGEAKAYVALLELGGSEATPLAKAANVPQPKIYGYLSNLEIKGIVIKAELSGKPKIYTPIRYDIVIKQLKDETDKKFNETEKVLDFIQKNQSNVEIGEYVSFVQGIKAVETGFKESILKIKQNAIILCSPYYNPLIDSLLVNKPEIKVKRPLTEISKNLENYPKFIQQLSNSPMLKTLKQNRPMVMFRDVDEKTQNCDAVVILGHPHDPAELTQEPLIVEITHKAITKFQVNIVLTIVELLEKMKTTLNN